MNNVDIQGSSRAVEVTAKVAGTDIIDCSPNPHRKGLIINNAASSAKTFTLGAGTSNIELAAKAFFYFENYTGQANCADGCKIVELL